MDPNSQPSPPPRPPPLSVSDTHDSSFRNSCTAICGDGGTSANSVRASIAERRAAKFGFNAQRISTARFRTTSPLASPSSTAVRSPCITIPPGISPTALLDSPIMLPNSQLSPTTGTFSLSLVNNYESSMPNEASQANGDKKNDGGSSFTFNPHGNPNYLPSFSSSNDQGNNVDCKALVLVEPSMGFEFSAELSHEAIKSCIKDSMPDVKALSNIAASTDFCDIQISGSDAPSSQNSLQAEPFSGNHHPLQEQNGTYTAIGTGRTSEDGYNWRKYGQKQVKGSEYPRSYYKCTHPNCQVKKKIERSHDGQITEIIYKGAHNHPKPQPSRRAQLGSASWFDEIPETDEGGEACLKVEGGSVWKNMQPGSKDVKVGSDLRADVLERTLSTSVVTELSDPLSTTQGKSMGTFESAETPELSSTLASHDDDVDDNDDGATQGTMSIGVNADDDESETKRRKTDTCLAETNLASRAVREPRVVVQIESEVDILDDGYRWRKYGQKVVKGNPNPRSYYKCTSAGCLVRKHVERASHNLKYVITTYEGKHNHEVPAARNSSHVNASGSNLSQAIVSAQPALTMTRNTNGPKTETQIQRFTLGFERKQELNKECLRPLVGNLGNEMKLGASSFYPMKCPSIQHTMPYGAFGLNTNHGASPFAGSITSLVPDFPISVPSSLQTTANLSLAGVTFGNNKLGGGIRPYFTGQQLIRPKQEQRDDNPYNAGPRIIERVNASSSSVYNGSIMGNFPS